MCKIQPSIKICSDGVATHWTEDQSTLVMKYTIPQRHGRVLRGLHNLDR